ncbi:2Fe-2S iron-sulfur cluster-binding protein [Ectobacillus panaciterrae]|uniref:2Fe-2S iron-sulfur cluster-binding protein n=1 Tax=Ectobacillus panaciterrae TaxID=363872 RepID=UPI0004131077|nr:2Fe-2S iron-sulfur cluster-binding protein [Ectobacillus panaciterrae]
MNKRTLTIGSLIPRNISINKVSKSNPSNPPDPEYRHFNKIILLQKQMKFEIQPTKGNLLDVALGQEQALQYKCRKGTCGVCTVKVAEGRSSLSLPNEKEQSKLKKALNDGYRLACQAEIL